MLYFNTNVGATLTRAVKKGWVTVNPSTCGEQQAFTPNRLQRITLHNSPHCRCG